MLIKKRSICVAVALVVTRLSAHAFADDLTYQGGLWNDGSSWSTGNVPNEYDAVHFTSDQTGDVQLNGGGNAYQVQFEGGSTGYNLIGEANALLRTAHIGNGGDSSNTISTDRLTGHDVDSEHSQLTIDGNELTINSSIVDDDDRPLELWMNATYHGLAIHSGMTHVVNHLRLVNGGAILLSPTVKVEKASLDIDNTGTTASANRLPDAGTLLLTGSYTTLTGNGASGTINRERVGGITLGAGFNGIETNGGSKLWVQKTAGGLTRDTSARGTLVARVNNGAIMAKPDGMIDDLVPYVMVENQYATFKPATYDAGPDGTAGTSDDVGIRSVTNFATFASFNNTSHLLLQDNQALTSSRTVRSLTLDGGRIDLGANGLTIDDGVLVVNNSSGTGATAAVIGGATSTLAATSGRELFVFSDGQDAEIGARISGNNGVTFTPANGFDYANGRFILTGSNVYSGQTTVNGGQLVLRSQSSLPTNSTLKLVESTFNLDYTPTAAFPNRIIFDTGSSTPFGAGSYLRPLELKPGQTFSFTGSMEGRGAYFVHGEGATMKIDTSASATAITAGEFSLWPQGTAKLQVDGQLGDGTTSFGSVILFDGTLTGKGRLTGGLQLSAGTVAPGSNGAAGTAVLRMRDLGAYGGTARFDINGLTRGTQYDSLEVDGNAYFAGDASHFTVENSSFVGLIGKQFDLIRYTSHYTATQPIVTIPLATQAGAQWIHYFDDDSFTVAVAGPSGDFNLDGKVNFSDLLTLAQHFGQSDLNWLQGDTNYDGKVNFTDLLTLAQHFGQNIMPGGTSFTVSPDEFAADWALAQSLAPEPASMVAIVGVTSVFIRRRRI